MWISRKIETSLVNLRSLLELIFFFFFIVQWNLDPLIITWEVRLRSSGNWSTLLSSRYFLLFESSRSGLNKRRVEWRSNDSMSTWASRSLENTPWYFSQKLNSVSDRFLRERDLLSNEKKKEPREIIAMPLNWKPLGNWDVASARKRKGTSRTPKYRPRAGTAWQHLPSRGHCLHAID